MRTRLRADFIAILIFLLLVLALIVRKAAGGPQEIGYWPVNVDELLESASTDDTYVPIGVNAFIMYVDGDMQVMAEINWNKSPSECGSKLYRWTGDGFVCEPEEVPMHCFPMVEGLPTPEITVYLDGTTIYSYENGAVLTYKPSGSLQQVFDKEVRNGKEK